VASRLSTVVFDLGGVVLGWDPRRPYQRVLAPEEVPAFLARIGFEQWNRALDAGRLFEAGEQELIERFPDSVAAIRAYREHFDQSLTGLVPGTGAVIAELQSAGLRLLALTNWSAETFPIARRFGLLRRFEDIVVSGQERLAKPDPAIFEVLFRRHHLDPQECLFVDDAAANVAAAAALGMTAVQFRDAPAFRSELVRLGLLADRAPVTGPIYHLTEGHLWRVAQKSGEYPWSSRDLTYEQQGYVHCSFSSQVAGVRSRTYADVADADLVLLELDPVGLEVVVEDLRAGAAFPHLYAPLPLEAVREVLHGN